MPDVKKEFTESLAHFGVPGMKWGKRKSASVSNPRPTRSEKKLEKADAKWAKKSKSKFPIKAYNAAAEKMNNGVIDKINNDPRFKDKDMTNPNAPLTKKYYDTYSKAFSDAMNEAAGPSPSGKSRVDFKYEITTGGLEWKVVDND